MRAKIVLEGTRYYASGWRIEDGAFVVLEEVSNG